MRIALAVLAGFMVALPAAAQAPLRDFCADRPGIGSPACIVDAGHALVELGLGDWTLDKQPDSRTDTVVLGNALVRYGLGATTEVQVGWQAYVHLRERDRTSRMIDRAGGVGDLLVVLKQSVANPDGAGLSVALQPFATIPTAGNGVGQGDWGGGLVVPVTYDLDDIFSLQANVQAEAAVDEDRHGRHFAYGGVVGIDAKLGERAIAAFEVQAIRDRDPMQHVTQSLAGLSFGFMAQEALQLDLGVNAGLNHDTPDAQVYFGISRRF